MSDPTVGLGLGGVDQLRERLDLFHLLHLHVSGIEVTQSIQYHRASEHLTDPADRGLDNSVVLVASKPAWARVYVRSGLFSRADIPGVTGTLDVYRRYLGFFYLKVATLAAQPPGTVTAHPDPAYVTERSILGSSLNFILPADLMCGHLKLVASIQSPNAVTDSSEVFLDVTLRQTLRLRGVMVGYNGPSSTAPGAPIKTLAAPTVTDLQTTSSWALRAFPVESSATYSSAGAITLTVPLSDPALCAGCCSANWLTLNAQVAAQVTADGNRTDVLYYGLLATGVPMGPIIGCESSGVSAGGVGDGVTLAHELGHHCGFPHAPCGSVGTPDSTYPAYEPYDPTNTPTASIGEYGFDISNGNIMPPSSFKDMMSYCGPKWISLHNYGRLVNHSKLDPRRSCVDWPWWRDYILADPGLIPEKWLPDPPPDPFVRTVDPVRLVSVIGVLRSEREFEATSVMRLESQPAPVGGARGELSMALLAADGSVLAEAPVYELRSQASCGCGGSDHDEPHYPRLVQALIPDVGRGAELTLRRGEETVWSRSAGDRRPKVGAFTARIEDGRLLLRFDVDSGDRPELWVQWAAGRDTEWRALTSSLTGDSAELDLGLLPAGPCRLRLLASDGFDTAVSRVVRVTVPRRGPDIAVLSPRAGETLMAGNPMRLWGSIVEPSPDLTVRWLLDGETVGDELDIFLTAPPAGRHALELQVRAGRTRSSAELRFDTFDPEAELRRLQG